MARYTISARIRENKGKGTAKKLRRDNQIPAIFYGQNTNPLMLALDYSDLHKILRQTAGDNIILGLQIESEKGSDSRTVMLKELQIDPIKDTYLHADFHEIFMDKEITVDVPLRLLNTPQGATKGGILQHVRREITISCLPDRLMESISVDVSGLDIGDALHIGDIELPDGVKTTQEVNLTVAVVMAPAVVSLEEEEVEEIEETEEKGIEEERAEADTQSEKET